MSLAIEELPSELLVEIFGLLPYRDRLVARLVCKRWAAVGDHAQFHQAATLRLTHANAAEIFAAASEAPQSLWPRLRNLRLDLVEPTPETQQQLQRLLREAGSVVRTLHVDGSLLEQASLELLGGLHELRISNAAHGGSSEDDDDDDDGLPPTPDLTRLPCLRSLLLDSSTARPLKTRLLQQLASGPSPAARLRMERLAFMFNSDEQELVLHVLESQAATLQRLDLVYFSHQPLHPGLWRRLFQQLERLESLQLTGNFKHELLTAILAGLPAEAPLKQLDLTGNVEVDDAVVSLVAERWPRTLERLELMFCVRVSDVGVLKLGALEANLRSLNLSHCSAVTGAGLLGGLVGKRNLRLRELNLNDLGHLDERGVETLAERLPRLEHLSLSGCSGAVTDLALASIFRHQTRLRSLDLDHCFRICDEGLVGFGPSGECSIRRLRGLEALSLRGCRNLSDQALLRGLEFPALRSLKLGYCHRISAVGIEGLVRRCPSIDTLIISSCLMLDDEAIGLLARHLRRLRRLNVSNCVNLTERAVDHIAECCDSLQELSICGIDALEVCDIQQRLLRMQPQLKELHV